MNAFAACGPFRSSRRFSRAETLARARARPRTPPHRAPKNYTIARPEAVTLTHIESIDRSCTSNAVFFSAKGGTFPDETPFAFEPGRDFRFIDGSERDVCSRRGRFQRVAAFFLKSRAWVVGSREAHADAPGDAGAPHARRRTRGETRGAVARSERSGR